MKLQVIVPEQAKIRFDTLDLDPTVADWTFYEFCFVTVGDETHVLPSAKKPTNCKFKDRLGFFQWCEDNIPNFLAPNLASIDLFKLAKASKEMGVVFNIWSYPFEWGNSDSILMTSVPTEFEIRTVETIELKYIKRNEEWLVEFWARFTNQQRMQLPYLMLNSGLFLGEDCQMVLQNNSFSVVEPGKQYFPPSRCPICQEKFSLVKNQLICKGNKKHD